MPGAGAILRDIHRLRKNAKDIQTRIAQGPQKLKAQQDRVTRQEETLHKAQDELKHLKVDTHQKEVSLKTVDEKIKKYEKQLADIMSKKEYEALKIELAHAREQAGKLEDEILGVMGQVEEKTARIPELEKNLKEGRAHVEQFVREYDERMARLGQEQKDVLHKLAEIEATLPEEITPAYQRLVNAKGEDALALVEGRICTACYTEITAQNEQDLLRGVFILCKNCGRIMYLAE
jgi:predicted  nucleic acid-binding Zn-ribbon protein